MATEIYVLSEFVNQNNLEENTFITMHQSKVSYNFKSNIISLIEENDLLGYFFNKKIIKLQKDKDFLLSNIRQSFQKNLIHDDSGVLIRNCDSLKSNRNLLPFLNGNSKFYNENFIREL